MSLPDSKITELISKWSNGNHDAAEFMSNIAAIARLADNITDGDSDDPVSDMGDLLYRTLITMQLNPFYEKHKLSLFPVIVNAIVGWQNSEKWRKSPEPKKRIFAFVYRELVEQIMWTVALITGGIRHVHKVADEIYEQSHKANGETFETWDTKEN